MLVIKTLNPTGMFSFGNSQDIVLQGQSLVNLRGVNEDSHGDSNGAGKSSVFNALCEVLYRQNPTGVSGDAVVNNLWTNGFAGRCTFSSWEQIDYRVTYCRKWKTAKYPEDNNNRTEYRGTQLFLEKLIDGIWVDHRGSTMQETSKRIESALGLTYGQFLAVAYMTPRQGNTLLRGSNKERQDVLTGLVGLEVWDSILDRVRHERKIHVKQKDDLDKQLAYAQGEIAQIKSQQSQSNLDNILEDISDCWAKVKENQGYKEMLETELVVKEEQLVQIQHDRVAAWNALGLDTRQKVMADIQNQISNLKVEKSSLRTSINPELSTRFHEVESSLSMARGKLAAIKGDNKLVDVENCPTCGSKITKAARDKMGKNIKNAESLVKQCEKHVAEVGNAVEADKAQQEKDIAYKSRNLDKQIDELTVQLAAEQHAYTDKSAEYNQYGAAIQEARTQVDDLKQRIQGFIQAMTQWEARAEALTSSVDAAKALGVALEAKEAQVSDLINQLSEVEHLVKHYDWFITNIPYIKLHKLSVALQDLSDIANSYLRSMGDTASINIFSFKELKKAKSELKIDQLKSEINVVITDGEKNIDPRLYSDGETARFSMALIRAMHDLALKHGQGCNLVLLDEIFSFVDVNNSQRIADSFTQVTPGATCIVTDNSGIAANLMNFDNVWVVKKTNGLSNLEIN